MNGEKNMSTRELLEHLAYAVEGLADDHKSRLARIEARRAHLAIKVDKIMKPLTTIRNALDEFETAMRAEIEALVQLEDAELTETAGEVPEEERAPFHEILKGNGRAA